MRNIILERQASRQLTSLQKQDKTLAKRIALKLKELQVNPINQDSKTLVNTKDLRRVRVGKYRIIYKFDEVNLYIILIEKRDQIYKLI